MASSSLSVIVNNKKLRTYGGTRGDVRRLELKYAEMSYDDFVRLHPTCTPEEFETRQVITKFNKKSRGTNPYKPHKSRVIILFGGGR